MNNIITFPVKFNGKKHEEAFYRILNDSKINPDNDALVSLVYTLTITRYGRDHFHECYVRKEDRINPDILKDPYSSHTDKQAIRLAFNLYNGRVPSARTKNDDELYNLYDADQTFAYNYYELFSSTPAEIFTYGDICCYFLEGIKIRYRLYTDHPRVIE